MRQSRLVAAAIAAVCLVPLTIPSSIANVWSSCALAGTGDTVSHGDGLNARGCHFNRKAGGCRCHQPAGCK